MLPTVKENLSTDLEILLFVSERRRVCIVYVCRSAMYMSGNVYGVCDWVCCTYVYSCVCLTTRSINRVLLHLTVGFLEGLLLVVA